jgi:hypothetical protein
MFAICLASIGVGDAVAVFPSAVQTILPQQSSVVVSHAPRLQVEFFARQARPSPIHTSQIAGAQVVPSGFALHVPVEHS